MKKSILMLAAAVFLFGSCKKEDKNPSGAGGTITAKAAPYTFVIDGEVYRPATFQGKVDGEDYVIQGLAANSSLGFLQVRFAGKPAAGTYAVEACLPGAGSFTAVTEGKCNIYTWGTDKGDMAWSNAASTGSATVTMKGDSAVVIMNDVVIKRGLEDKFHTVSVNFTSALQ